MRRANRFPFWVGVLLAGLAGVCAAQQQSPMLHKPAPSFVRRDLAGNSVSLGKLRGKVVLLNFWATWCGPCLEELPQFKEWQRRYGPEGFEVIAVSMDDTADPVRVFVGRLKPDFRVVMGDENLGHLYGGVYGLPVTYLIGRDGRIEARIDGSTDLDALEARVESLLKKQAR